MNEAETTTLLRTRSALTSQPYGPETVLVWQEAFSERPYDECRAALLAAARETKTITVAHIVERLPRRLDEPPPTPDPGPGIGLREYLATHPGAPSSMHPRARRRSERSRPC